MQAPSAHQPQEDDMDKITIERETLRSTLDVLTEMPPSPGKALVVSALRAALAQKAEPDEQEVALQEIAEFGQDQLREPRTQKEKEQYAFEDWLASECPSGSVESVQRQWEESAEYLELQDATPAQPTDAQPTGQSPCARHCEAPAFEGEIRRLKRELQTQAERIRVLREALDVARNGLAWYIDMHPDEADDSDAETMAQIDAALEATK